MYILTKVYRSDVYSNKCVQEDLLLDRQQALRMSAMAGDASVAGEEVAQTGTEGGAAEGATEEGGAEDSEEDLTPQQLMAVLRRKQEAILSGGSERERARVFVRACVSICDRLYTYTYIQVCI